MHVNSDPVDPEDGQFNLRYGVLRSVRDPTDRPSESFWLLWTVPWKHRRMAARYASTADLASSCLS